MSSYNRTGARTRFLIRIFFFSPTEWGNSGADDNSSKFKDWHRDAKKRDMRGNNASMSLSISSNGNGAAAKKRNFMDSFQRFLDLDSPKAVSRTAAEAPAGDLISASGRSESVEAKWEHLRYFDDRPGGGQQQQVPDSSYGSLASSTSSSSNNDNSEEKLTKFQKLKKNGWKRLKRQLFGRRRRTYKKGTNVHYDEVSTSPDGQNVSSVPSYDAAAAAAADYYPDPSKLGSAEMGVIPRIRSSKSMQNLEQITRGSYLNLRDATANLRHKYHSRLEVRETRPRSVYQELDGDGSDYDEDDDEDFRQLRGIR